MRDLPVTDSGSEQDQYQVDSVKFRDPSIDWAESGPRPPGHDRGLSLEPQPATRIHIGSKVKSAESGLSDQSLNLAIPEIELAALQ